MSRTVPSPAAVDDVVAGKRVPKHSTAVLALLALGVVYGDIGTSPLYAAKETFNPEHGIPLTPDNIFGGVSAIFWSLMIIVSLKYVLLVMRASNRGEGGIMALLALATAAVGNRSRLRAALLAIGVFGAALFYGDAVLTPAISVLSAVEGLEVGTEALKPYIVPISAGILIALFAIQHYGTGIVGLLFGPICALWFISIGAVGAWNVIQEPTIIKAVDPRYAVHFATAHGVASFVVLGSVLLAVTGAEALYADLGHFGRRPIQCAWLGVVQPALLLNYFGQGALLLARPDAIENPFYKLYPGWALIPMVALATIATVIASQAVITGAFSFTRQAIQLGLMPRLEIRHTSESVAGQIYLPRINQILFVGVVLVTLAFRSSSNLAAAYGLSVTATMVIDSLMAFFVVWRYWRWPFWRAALLMVPLVLIEQAFLVANVLKITEGGWLPLTVAGIVATVVFTWVRGTKSLARATRKNEAELEWLARRLDSKPPHRVPGTAVFLTGDPDSAPTSLLHNLKHNRVLHVRNIILTIKTEDTPRVPRHERIEIDRVADTFIRVTARYGFMETPSVPKIIEHCRRKDLDIDIAATSFFLSRRSLKTARNSDMPLWQERLFIWLAGRAEDATEYFRIPSDRVVEVGTQVMV